MNLGLFGSFVLAWKKSDLNFTLSLNASELVDQTNSEHEKVVPTALKVLDLELIKELHAHTTFEHEKFVLIVEKLFKALDDHTSSEDEKVVHIVVKDFN